MKKIIANLLLVLLLLILVSCSAVQQDSQNDPRTWKYFRILASTKDDSLFVKLQNGKNIH